MRPDYAFNRVGPLDKVGDLGVNLWLRHPFRVLEVLLWVLLWTEFL